jgi:hypothetical protein
MGRKKNVIKCSCRNVIWGHHRSSWGKVGMQKAILSLRHKTNQLLKMGEFDKAIDIIVSAGYLD